MALAVVQHKQNSTSVSAVTVDVTVTATVAGHLLVMGTVNGGTRTVTSVATTAGANAFTQFGAGSAHAINGVQETDVWFLLSAPASVTTWRVTFSGLAGTFDKEGFFWEVSGFTTPAADIGGTTTTAATGTTVNGASVLTTSTTGFVVGIAQQGGTVTATPLSGNEFTSGGDISTAGDASCSLISSTAAAHKPQWLTDTSGTSVCSSTAAFKETAAGGSKLKMNSILNGLGASGPFFNNAVGYHKTPDISLQAYEREREREIMEFIRKVKRAA